MIPSHLVGLAGKRLCALDVGKKRIGVAVCDEMHIVVSTRPVIEMNASAVDAVLQRCHADRIEVLIVGMPKLTDDRESEIQEFIRGFVTLLRSAVSIPVVEVDEAFSTSEARKLMVAGGMSKKKRQAKGVKDQMAAGVILRDLIEDVRTYRRDVQ